MEKATNKRAIASGIFTTGSYQAGFKIGGSCGYDQARLLAEVNKELRKKKKNKKLYTLLDITTAFDCVKRPKLWVILDAIIAAKRAAALRKFADRGEAEITLDKLEAQKLNLNIEEWQTIKIKDLNQEFDNAQINLTAIKILYRDHSIQVGDEAITTHNGVIQGSINSPWMFACYLEALLYSDENIKAMCIEELILAFADDLLLVSKSWGELRKQLKLLQ